MGKPSISQYLVSACLLIIDELNEQYSVLDRKSLLKIANDKFNELDIAVRIGYPFKQMAHYQVKVNNNDKNSPKSNHDIYIESKDFLIEVKYLKNWKAGSKNSKSNSTVWKAYQADFDWLLQEIDMGNKHNRAFIIGWFNCIDYIGQSMQLGQKDGGCKPLVDEKKLEYFPFLHRTKRPTYTMDLVYNYGLAYDKILPVSPTQEKAGDYSCIFLGSEKDVFHFAIYF